MRDIIDGKELIRNMQEEKDLKFWSSCDLIDYIKEYYSTIVIENYDSRLNKVTFYIEGFVTPAVLHSLYISAINEEGTMRG